jgi:hypothetical protein
MSSMFEGATAFTFLDSIDSWDLSSLKNAENMFAKET